MPLAFIQRDWGRYAQELEREGRPAYRPDGGDYGRDQSLEVAGNIGMDSVEELGGDVGTPKEVPQNSRVCRGQQRTYW